MANERTFLAWIRTSLALLAGSVLLDQVAGRIPAPAFIPVLAVAASVVSSLMCLMALRRWKANEIAMRHDRPLPSSFFIVVLSNALMIVAATVAILLARFL